MTALFPWDEKYSVGITEIDMQHKRLFAIANDYFEQKKKQQSPELEERILKDLLDYTRQHFSYEEELLKKNGYPYYAEHMREHMAVFTQIEAFSRAAAGILNLRADTSEQNIADFLIKWLSHHIVEKDHNYAAYLAKRASSNPGTSSSTPP
jgi:hemerythrin-like metal-binding protein